MEPDDSIKILSPSLHPIAAGKPAGRHIRLFPKVPLLNGAEKYYQSPNYKYTAPTALDALNPSEVLFPAADPFHVRQILRTASGQFVPH